MLLSSYVLNFPWPEDTDFRLLYSTRTSAKALVPVETLAELASNSLDNESAETLSSLGFIVADPAEERQQVFAMVEEINRQRTAMNISIVVNMHCNFRCRYCYEGSRKSKRFMSRETIEQVVSFVRQRFNPGMTRLTLDFYGGEPLLSPGLIARIAGELKPFAESRGAKFELTLVSNGSLLTPAMVNRLLPYGLKRAKITIDGPPENHNYFRPYRSGRPSFDTIINNVRDCCRLIKISISGNFTRENFRRFPALFAHLEARQLGPENLHYLSFSPVIQVNDDFSAGFCGGCASSKEKWLAEAAPFLRQEILKRGYAVEEISPSLCMVDVENSFVVHYDGSLYKCVALVGHPEYICGNVWAGMKDYRRQYHLDHWRNNDECRDCVYLPLCFGGCRYMALQREGCMDGVDCQKDYFAAILENLVRQDIIMSRSGSEIISNYGS